MATIKITFDQRESSTTKDNKFMLVLRIGHNRKTRDIPFNLHLKENQYDFATGKIIGILNATQHTKRTRKIYSDVDLYIEEHDGKIKNWKMDRLKSEIEQRLFNKSPSRTILNYGAVYLNRLRMEGQFSTASSYEDALKALIKFRKQQKGQDDMGLIKTLYEVKADKLQTLEDIKNLDMEIPLGVVTK